MKKEVTQIKNGVKINFTGAVQKRQIVQMVENCSTGKCACMSEETKKKITTMEVSGKDGNVKLQLGGDLSREEIETALKRSKVLRPEQ